MRATLPTRAARAMTTLLVAAMLVGGCSARPPERVVGAPAGRLAPREVHATDATPKAEPRMVPPEVYVRTYLKLFGDVTPLEAEALARGADRAQLFDTWGAYTSVLGFPDHGKDVPRQSQTNALMVATFDRLAIALCDRAAERELSALAPPARAAGAKASKRAAAGRATRGSSDVEVEARDRAAAETLAPSIFAFEPKAAVNEEEFAERFDVLHRTFLGYPASLAPPERAPRFFALYSDIVQHHAAAAPRSKLSPAQAGWAAVCYGLARHPEFHLY